MVCNLLEKYKLQCVCVFLLLFSSFPLCAGNGQDPASLLAKLKANLLKSDCAYRVVLTSKGETIPMVFKIKWPSMLVELTDQKRVLRISLEGQIRVEEYTDESWHAISQSASNLKVGETVLTVEDLSLRFIYLQHFSNVGPAMLTGHLCQLIKFNDIDKVSHYDNILMWLDVQTALPMIIECFDDSNILRRRFRVVALQNIKDQWILKRLRIESMSGEETAISYLEILDQASADDFPQKSK